MRRFIIGLALMTLAVSATQAATIVQIGTDVTFTYDDSTLYGTGTVVGNSIFFSPTAFQAESLNADGAVSANATLNITVEVNPGSAYVMTEFLLAEQGDYLLTGGSSSVSAEGQLQVTSNIKTCLVFPCMDSEIFTAGPLTTVGTLTGWTINSGIDFANTAGWGTDTSVQVQIQNVLLATSTVNGESAMVQKKFEAVGLILNPVPVPAAVWLFGSALGLLGWMKRTKTLRTKT